MCILPNNINPLFCFNSREAKLWWVLREAQSASKATQY